MGKINIFYGSQVDIEGAWIRWDNRTCFLSAISQIWIGNPNEGKWGFMKDSEQEGLNVELKSGTVHSFLSNEHDFLVQAYELLCGLAAIGISEGKNTIDFENNVIEIYEEAEEEEEPEILLTPVLTGNTLIIQELDNLSEHLKKKETVGTAVLQLLEDITGCYGGTCNKALADLYKIFIQLSLINDCNELGLNTLIEEVKSNIYRV